MTNKLTFFVFALSVASSRALSIQHLSVRYVAPQPQRSPIRQLTTLLAADEGQEELIQDNTNESSTAVYGVSYIGGDPCGSKYNDDPFDATKENAFKPGLPDDVKDRIAALAAKKAKELEEKDG